MRPLPDLPAPVSELTSPTVAGGSPLACRPACAACCIAPSISTPIPGMPDGKPAGVRCVQLDADGRCALFGQAARPAVCLSLLPSAEMCGENPVQALQWLARLEVATAPSGSPSKPPPNPPSHDKTARGYRAV